MADLDMVLTLAMVTFALVSFWMYQSKKEAESGLVKKRINDSYGGKDQRRG